MEFILISACLLGKPVRYDGHELPFQHPLLSDWISQGRVIPFCPETAAGLPVPRPPAEILEGDGAQVLDGIIQVIDLDGSDVTQFFIQGARKTLDLALHFHVKAAILKDGSPSCGSSWIYDGSFSGRRKPAEGVTTALLRQAGIAVYSEDRIAEADRYLSVLKACEEVP
jgi:uncharacterized protein YbbK (DUF523 family)